MAASTGASVSLRSRPVNLSRSLATSRFMGQRVVSFSGFGSKQRFSGLRVFCAEAKPATVNKVCEIVKSQLALSEDSAVDGKSKFSELGADSLDTVEIVMKLEEAFGITVEEESAQTISTVQDAADLIEKLCQNKKA